MYININVKKTDQRAPVLELGLGLISYPESSMLLPGIFWKLFMTLTIIVEDISFKDFSKSYFYFFTYWSYLRMSAWVNCPICVRFISIYNFLYLDFSWSIYFYKSLIFYFNISMYPLSVSACYVIFYILYYSCSTLFIFRWS